MAEEEQGSSSDPSGSRSQVDDDLDDLRRMWESALLSAKRWKKKWAERVGVLAKENSELKRENAELKREISELTKTVGLEPGRAAKRAKVEIGEEEPEQEKEEVGEGEEQVGGEVGEKSNLKN